MISHVGANGIDEEITERPVSGFVKALHLRINQNHWMLARILEVDRQVPCCAVPEQRKEMKQNTTPCGMQNGGIANVNEMFSQRL